MTELPLWARIDSLKGLPKVEYKEEHKQIDRLVTRFNYDLIKGLEVSAPFGDHGPLFVRCPSCNKMTQEPSDDTMCLCDCGYDFVTKKEKEPFKFESSGPFDYIKPYERWGIGW